MRAVQVRAPGGLDRLEIVECELPGAPGPGQIQVALHASSINYHDYLVAKGDILTADGRVPMSDGAGVITAVGDGVIGFSVGDHVVSHFFLDWRDGLPDQRVLNKYAGDTVDGYAQEAVVRDEHAFTLAPKGYSHPEAATLTCAGVTAWRALVVEGRLRPGESVLIQGSGGVALFGLQISKMLGARVIAMSSSDEKLDRLKQLGADHLINYRTTPEWGETARVAAGGDGVDHILEIGGPGTLPQSLQAVRNGGHISMIGVLSGFEGPVSTAALLTRQVRLIGVTVGSHRHLRDFVQAIEANGLRPIIDRSFGLDEIADAFRHQQTGKHFGKITLDW